LAEFTSRTPAEKLLEAARSTEAWLDRYFQTSNLPKPAAPMVNTLRRYLVHCRRVAESGRVSPAEADRRIRRMLRAAYELMKYRPD
jgi:hypothetical protein